MVFRCACSQQRGESGGAGGARRAGKCKASSSRGEACAGVRVPEPHLQSSTDATSR